MAISQLHSQGQEIKNIPREYLDIARGMEQQFIQYMIEQMRRTINPANPGSTTLKFYQSLLNSHQASIMAQQNEGRGLQKIIIQQIYQTYKKKGPNNE